MQDIIIETLFGSIHLELADPDPVTGQVTGEILSGFADAADYFDPRVDDVNLIESLILAHACAGVDVQSLAYIEGITNALQAIENSDS